MADTKISALPAAGPITGNEILVGVQDVVTKKIPVLEIAKLGFQPPLELTATSIGPSINYWGRWLRVKNDAAVTFTVPAIEDFVEGTIFNGVQAGVGKLSFVAEVGATINKATGYNRTCRAKGSSFALIKVGFKEWDLVGDFEDGV